MVMHNGFSGIILGAENYLPVKKLMAGHGCEYVITNKNTSMSHKFPNTIYTPEFLKSLKNAAKPQAKPKGLRNKNAYTTAGAIVVSAILMGSLLFAAYQWDRANDLEEKIEKERSDFVAIEDFYKGEMKTLTDEKNQKINDLEDTLQLREEGYTTLQDDYGILEDRYDKLAEDYKDLSDENEIFQDTLSKFNTEIINLKTDNDMWDKDKENELLEKYPLLKDYDIKEGTFNTLGDFLKPVFLENKIGDGIFDETDPYEDPISYWLCKLAKQNDPSHLVSYSDIAEQLGLDETSTIGFDPVGRDYGHFRMPDEGIDPLIHVETVGVLSFPQNPELNPEEQLQVYLEELEDRLISEFLNENNDIDLKVSGNTIYEIKTDKNGNDIYEELAEFYSTKNYVIQLDKFGEESKIVLIGDKMNINPCNSCQNYHVIKEIGLNQVYKCVCGTIQSRDFYFELYNKNTDPDKDGLSTAEEEKMHLSPINENTDNDKFGNDKEDPHPLEDFW